MEQSSQLSEQDAHTAAKAANDLAHDRYLIINACMDVLEKAAIVNDAPLPALVERLAGERDKEKERCERFGQQNDELSAEHEMMRHQTSEARISAQAANNAMYHAIQRERAAQAQARVSSSNLAAVHSQLEETQRECAELRAERQALCDLLSADPRTVAGQTLVEAIKRVSSSDFQAQLEDTQRERDEWRGLAERRRDELAGILEDAQALSRECAELRASAEIAVARWKRSEAIRKAAVDQIETLSRELSALHAAQLATKEPQQ